MLTAEEEHELGARLEQHGDLDAANGKIEWTFLPDGKVDSPPSYHRGRLVFGARDGSVYCLDAASGQLAWRFRAAPQDRQMGAFEQLESAWPLFGTLLIHDDKVYCAAGRNTNVNMGFFLYQLDIHTGRPLIAVHHAADLSTQGEVDATVNADILVGDGSILHMRGMVFDMKTLKMIDLGKRFVQRARISPPHKMEIDLVMALGGFQDESFFNGALWHYRSKTANIISLDRGNMYGVNIYASNSFKSHTHVNFHPGKESIKLFSVSRKSLTDRSPKGMQGQKKGSGLHAESGARPEWTATIPIRAKSLLVGSDKLFLAGVRDKIDASDPWAHFDGRMGGMITVHSKEDGRLVSQIELKSPAVFDGLASAGGKLQDVRDVGVLEVERDAAAAVGLVVREAALVDAAIGEQQRTLAVTYTVVELSLILGAFLGDLEAVPQGRPGARSCSLSDLRTYGPGGHCPLVLP